MEKSSEFTPPEFWSFKPFFTLQPVQETREKQLKLWRELILKHCAQFNVHHLIPTSFPYFKNESIDRQLSSEAISAVIDYIIKTGNAEWTDNAHTTLRMILKSADVLAGELYSWVLRSELLGSVYTIYELHSSEDYQDSEFFGCDPVMLRRALEILQSNDKCKILKGSNPDEDGVKFLQA